MSNLVPVLPMFQVRWPTRCKRCFRDYKEHSDENDRSRFNRLEKDDGNRGLRPGFNKSRSLDVAPTTANTAAAAAAGTAGGGAEQAAADKRCGSVDALSSQ